MKVRFIKISNFRGFERLELTPRGHVLLVGEPGAGRSDLVEALWRVLSPESSRSPLLEDLDFFNRDLNRRIEVEAVLGELGTHLEQTFFDRLELWDVQQGRLMEELHHGTNRNSYEQVVRLCYRASWDPDQQQARQWVDFPKFSDPEGGDFRAVPRVLREELPVAFIVGSGSSLSLGVRGELRRMVDAQQQTDFSTALDRLTEGIGELAEGLTRSQDLSSILERILKPLREPLDLGDRPVGDIVRFAPEGGSLAGVLRGLQPTMKLRESLGFLPLVRHGSTLSALLQLCQAIAQGNNAGTIVVIDDFGENMDLDAAQHLAGTLRLHAAQLWLSTRRGPIGRCFRPEELIRLTTSPGDVRRAHYGQVPTSKAERLAARHLHLQILPAVSSKALVIVEGPHDRSVLEAAAAKLNVEEGISLPAAQRIALLDAGAAEGSGGIGAIPRLASLARKLGFHVTALVDWDVETETADQRLAQNLKSADVVIRWPKGHGIEKALLAGLDEEVIRVALGDVSEALAVPLGSDPVSCRKAELTDFGLKFLKSSGGLHAAFLDALPPKCVPPLLRRCLEEIRKASSRTGLVQL